jgi:hypothetical protein
MAKKATNRARPKSASKAASRPKGSAGRRRSEGAADALIHLLQSPLVAELVAVAATAALASLAEEGFGGRGAKGGKRAGRAVKQAGKAAANAIGRRLTTEIDEIKKAAKAKKG